MVKSKNNIKKALPLVITGLTIFSNYYFPKKEGKSIGDVSDKYGLPVTPAGWTFSIWGLIYSSLAYISYKHLKGDFEWSDKSIALYALSGICNALWISKWIKEDIKSSQYLLYGISLSLLLLWYDNIGKKSKVLNQNVIALYLTWTLGASILNTGFYSKYSQGGSEVSISKNVLYAVMATQVLWQIIKKNDDLQIDRKESFMLPLVGAWTGLGILTNGKEFNKIVKPLPLLVSIAATKFHLNKIGIKTNNPLKIIKELKNLLV